MLAKVKRSALALSTAERILLVQDIWDSIAQEPERVEIPQWHKRLIDERAREHARNPSRVLSWPEVKRRVEQSLAKNRSARRKRKG